MKIKIFVNAIIFRGDSISTKLMVDGNIVIGKTRVLESILKLEEAHEGGIISPVDIYNELKGTTRI